MILLAALTVLLPFAAAPTGFALGPHLTRALGRVRPVFARAFCVDELYAHAIVRPVRALARYVRTADERGPATGTAVRRVGAPVSGAAAAT